MVFFLLEGIEQIHSKIERIICKAYYKDRCIRKKHKDTMIVMMDVLMTLGRLSYRQARGL
ncbi:MAG: hypothetical protein RMJ37_05855 [Spirochaetia bacterium]|nr:hypothetical protein [Spirochaetota bacterium]MCX8097311.1 hypothetical protein [Spirochaetota bacterium]MDW8112840.1 hypothetical protein [Spirochaetia bacterium]